MSYSNLCHEIYVGETYLSNSSGSQNSGIRAKRSPLSSKASSLRMPSQKMGFFDDMVSFLKRLMNDLFKYSPFSS